MAVVVTTLTLPKEEICVTQSNGHVWQSGDYYIMLM